ncbi:MAG TPA: tRNA lysidine(34) synthetase TilS [Desulfobacteraceae bacterium]|nr:tRNA lysidine(34) synthetase TilS [Desulfobacteraceae bacterium]
MHALERDTLKNVRREGLLRAADKSVLVGVSGGPDSVALLHVLAALRSPLDITLAALYVDHGLRPEESTAEKDYVRALAEKLETGFASIRVEVRRLAGEKKLSLEHAARDLRYAALRQTAAEFDAGCIAVAHTADDQAEEVLLRLLRGSGRKGLSGMRSRSRDIIRPFLRFGKARILDYLRERQIHFFDDSTNVDLRYLRNRVRHQLLPYLETNFDRGIRRALCKTADSLAEDENLLERMTSQALEVVVARVFRNRETSSWRIVLNRAGLLNHPVAIQRRIIEKLLWEVGGTASYHHIVKITEAAAGARSGSELHLAGGLRVGIRKDFLEFLFPRGSGPWRGRLYPDRRSRTAD